MTTVMLLNVPFESNYKDTVWFETEQAQRGYFQQRIIRDFSDFSYQRKDNIIRVPVHIDSLYNCNYVMYKNPNASNKWFYAFIIDMKYVNEERTDITIQTDVMQTWMFDYSVRPSFVEREHVRDDTIGIHTVPEMLETGEYVCNGVDKKKSLNYSGIIVGATVDLKAGAVSGNGTFPNVNGASYGGVFSGVRYFYYASPIEVSEVLTEVAKAGQSDSIVSIFMCPSTLIPTTNGSVDGDIYTLDGDEITFERKEYKQEWVYFIDGDVNKSDYRPQSPTSIGKHTPKNNKLLTYPYCYMLASNNSGSANIFHYELFSNRFVDFLIEGAITPGMSIKLVPKNYKGVDYNYNESLSLGKLPVCSWNNDVYTNWLTQNSINIATNFISGGAEIVSGIASAKAGGGAGNIFSGVMNIANSVGEIYQHSKIPPTLEGNLNSGDVMFSTGELTFTLYHMSIKPEYAQIIDEYFTMFGYKVNRVKLPESDHRTRFWYTKTIDVNIDGAIPNKDLEQIKQNYNNGITFWRDSTEMGDYVSPNNIIKAVG